MRKSGKKKFMLYFFLSLIMVLSFINVSLIMPTSAEEQAYWLVIGSYDQMVNADAMADKLILLGEAPEKVPVVVNGKNYTRVVVGPFSDRTSGLQHAQILVAAGVQEPWLTFMSLPQPIVTTDVQDILQPDFAEIIEIREGTLSEEPDLPADNVAEEIHEADPVEPATQEIQLTLESEPEISVGIFSTFNKTGKMEIGADFDLVVKGNKIFVNGSSSEMKEVSMQGTEFTLTTGENSNEIRCESKTAGIITFTGEVFVEPAPEATVPANKFVWVNSKIEVYRGRFKFFRNSNSGITTVNLIPVESYIRGVLVSEIGADAPLEALCAQAVAVRTEVCFKSRHASEGYNFCSSTHCQSYTGASSEYRVTILDEVINRTRGRVMTYNGVPIDEAKFYSSCGGVSESSKDIWGSDIPYLVSVNCEVDMGVFTGDLRDEAALAEFISSSNANHLCSKASGYRWKYSYTSDALQKRLENLAKTNKLADSGALLGIEVVARSQRGAATEIKVLYENGSFNIKGENSIRVALGGTSVIKSAVFVINVTEKDGKTSYEFNGAGFGHGVGLCQNGARQMAKLGADYEKILTTYYAGVSVSRIFD